jgi:hypothetical protein
MLDAGMDPHGMTSTCVFSTTTTTTRRSDGRGDRVGRLQVTDGRSRCPVRVAPFEPHVGRGLSTAKTWKRGSTG